MTKNELPTLCHILGQKHPHASLVKATRTQYVPLNHEANGVPFEFPDGDQTYVQIDESTVKKDSTGVDTLTFLGQHSGGSNVARNKAPLNLAFRGAGGGVN